MHLGETHRGIILETTVSPADYETRTDNEMLISPTAFYLCLCTLLCCVACLIKFQTIMRDGDEAKDPVSESFRILEGIKTDTGSVFGK